MNRRRLYVIVQLKYGPLHDRRPQRWILINPCNSGLTGCKLFPYFPKGGPVPKQKVESTTHRDWQPLGYVTQWGGMEVGTGMLYPISVIDGLVHIYGGSKLQTELYWLRQKHCWNKFWSSDGMNTNEPCPVGHAVITSAGNAQLAQQYDRIVHTTPPFYKYNTHPSLCSEALLSKCYENALHLATLIPTTTGINFDSESRGMTNVVAMPLLGSGARGFPIDIACQIAAESIIKWISKPSLYSSSNGDALTHATTTTTKSAIQQHVYSHSIDDNDNIRNDNIFSAPPTLLSIDATTNNKTHQQLHHERIVFGLLDAAVAEKLADQITKQIG
jgi:O-acetyl-ADP-ribose deacetylase (regulator of RNase III)